MKAIAICSWSLRHAVKQPMPWVMLGAGFAVVPLCHAMSPIAHLADDSAWQLARDWSGIFGMLGASLGVWFLSQQGEFLRMLANRTRWAGEWGTLILGTGVFQAPLGLGALHIAHGPEPAASWLLLALANSVIETLAAFLVLRMRTSASTRILTLWIFLWGLPGLFG